MPESSDELLWKLAESDEVQIETRTDPGSSPHQTTIWIVPTADGVYVRSVRGNRGRWYREAVANPEVVVSVGRRKVRARADLEKNPKLIRAVTDAYREKYSERWPAETDSMLRDPVLPATLRLTPLPGGSPSRAPSRSAHRRSRASRASGSS